MTFQEFLAGQTLTAAALNDAFDRAIPLRADKTIDESVTSSTVLQNDDELSVPVGLNATYDFEAFILTMVAGSVVDIQVAWAFPAGATLIDGGIGPEVALGSGADISQGKWQANTIDFTSPSTARTYGSSSIATNILLKGTLITTNTAGNLTFQWAQAASSGTPQKVLGGSWLRAWRRV